MARWVTTAANEFEADMILARLRDAGVSAWPSRAAAPRGGMGQPCDIYVEDADLDRARAALDDPRDVSDAELTRLAEEAGPPPPD